MANVVIFEPGKRPQYLQSVSTGDYVVDPTKKKDEAVAKDGVLLNPDITAVEGVPTKYWKLSGKAVVEMSKAEKDVVDAAEKEKRAADIENYKFDGGSLARALVDAKLISKKDLIDFIKVQEGV